MSRRGTPLTPEAIARRRPIWEALSDVFLDTETRWYLPRIAKTLVDSGLAWETLECIWRHEIFPECHGNLWSVAGEWAMIALDEPSLIRRAEAGPTAVGRLLYRARSGILETQWQALGSLFRLLSALPEAERGPHVEVWSLLAHAYVDRELSTLLFVEEKRRKLQQIGWPAARVRATFERDFRPVYRTLLFGDDEAVHAANVAAFLAPLGEAQGTTAD